MSGKPDGILKHLAIAFGIAIVLYAISFSWIEHRRTFRGPWRITFLTDNAGRPSLRIAQAYLKISEQIDFPQTNIGPKNLSADRVFKNEETNLPFGKWVFQDPTFLPGTVTMQLFGHEVELLPRVLILDKKEIPWETGGKVSVK